MLIRILKKLTNITEFITKVGFRTFFSLKNQNVHYSRYDIFNKTWLKNLDIGTVLDIGANVGEFSLIFSHLFNKPDIYAFEPLPECIKKLENINKINSNIKVLPYALGDSNSTEIMHVSSWAPSSSLLKMGELHKKAAPHSAGSEDININVKRLDDIFPLSNIKNNLLIKMDVQGFEKKVMEGGENTFKQASVVVLEMSFNELYDDEPGFHELYSKLIDMGFLYHGSLKQSVNKDDQSYLQCDGIFLNKNINI